MNFDLWQRLVPRRFLEKKLRFTLTLLGISVGIALFLAIRILNHSTLVSFRQSLEQVSGQAALTVYTGGASFPESVLDLVEKTEGVKYAIPLVEARAFYEATDGAFQSFTVLCVDLLKEGGLRSYKSGGRDLIEDPLVFLNQADSIMLPRAFATKLGLKNESPLELFGAQGRTKFTLRGLLDDEGTAKAYGGGIGIMDIDGCRLTFGKVGLLDKIDIVPHEGVTPEMLSARLTEPLAKLGLKVGRANDQAAAFEIMIAAFQNLLSFIGWLAVLVSFFIVTDTVQVSIAERTKEIATLRALGASRGFTLRLLLWESVTLGLLGSVLGFLLGVGLAGQLMTQVSASLSSQFVRDIDITNVHVETQHLLMALALGLLSCVAATLVPAWRASRRDIVDDLRNRGEEGTKVTQSGRRKTILGAICLVALVTLVPLHLSARYPIVYGLEALFVVGTLLGLAPVVVEGGLAGLRRLIGRGPTGRTRFLASLAVENLLRNRERTKSNVLGLVVSLGLVIVISTLNSSARSSIVGWFRKTLHADFVVSSYGNLLSNRSQIFSETIRGRVDALPGLREEGGVRSYGLRWVNFEYRGVDLTVKAFDPPPPSRLGDLFDLVEAPAPEEIYAKIFRSDETPYAMASTSFFKTFGAKIGDEIEIRTMSGPLRVKLLGSVVDYISPKGVIYLSRSVYKRYWQDSLLAALFVNVEDSVDRRDFKARFDKAFFDVGLQALPGQAILEQGEASVNEAFGFTGAIELAAVLVALFGLINTLFVGVLNRIREFGMIRSIGGSRVQLRGLVLFESGMLSLVGALTALIFGYILSRFWVLESLPEMLGWPLRFVFPFATVLKILGLGVGVGILAGWAPSTLVAKRSPTELMREDA